MAGSGIFLENEKISVASVFEAANFVARTEQPTEKRVIKKMGKRGKGSSGLDESEEDKIKKNGGKVSENYLTDLKGRLG
jgi:hypothetical protein